LGAFIWLGIMVSEGFKSNSEALGQCACRKSLYRSRTTVVNELPVFGVK
jgi:hypothetical protein